MSNVTVSKYVDELITDGYVQEIGLGESEGGRRPRLLRLNPDAGYIVGLDFHAASIMAVLTDFEASIVASVEQEIDPDSDRVAVIKRITESVHEVIEKSGVDRKKLLGIGVGAPGLIDSRSGVCLLYYRIKDWENVPLRSLMELEFNVPIYLEKGIRCMALGEKWFGAGKDVDNLVCLTIRSGIGMGIIVDGKIFRGAGENAGEIGHITVDRRGPRCSCGGRGCLETLASGRALVERARRRLADGVNSSILAYAGGDVKAIRTSTIIKAAQDGDTLATRLLTEAGEYIGIAVANMINLLNPALVILAGDLIEAGDLIMQPIRKRVDQGALSSCREDAQIVFTELGRYVGAIGAVTVVLEKPFRSSWED